MATDLRASACLVIAGPGGGRRDDDRPHLSPRSRLRAHRGEARRALGARIERVNERLNERATRAARTRHGLSRPVRPVAAVRSVARAAARGDRHRRGAAVHGRRCVDRVRAHVARPRGKPRIAMLSLAVPIDSPYIVESKSVKLYLGSFAQTRFDDDVGGPGRDRAGPVGGNRWIGARRHPPRMRASSRWTACRSTTGRGDRPLRGRPVAAARGGAKRSTRRCARDLFRSVCPVTGQPDYASISIAYRGPRIDRACLLRYLVSFRLHAGFHEHCAERIFVDLLAAMRVRVAHRARPLHAPRRPRHQSVPHQRGKPVPPNVRAPRQ